MCFVTFVGRTMRLLPLDGFQWRRDMLLWPAISTTAIGRLSTQRSVLHNFLAQNERVLLTADLDRFTYLPIYAKRMTFQLGYTRQFLPRLPLWETCKPSRLMCFDAESQTV